MKKGVCAGLDAPTTATSSSTGVRGVMPLPYPLKNSPFLTPEAVERMRELQKDMPLLTPSEQNAIPPQSRNVSSLFFANILQGFSGVFKGR